MTDDSSAVYAQVLAKLQERQASGVATPLDHCPVCGHAKNRHLHFSMCGRGVCLDCDLEAGKWALDTAPDILRPMSRPPKKARTVKVSDELWEAAMAKADERQEVLSEEIRKFLEGYARKGGKR